MKKQFKLSSQLVCVLVSFLLFLPAVQAQKLKTPNASPKAKTYQTVGLTDMKVVYHRPLVKERTVWGELVPYEKVWRAGANENTIFWTSSDINVEGQKLPKGVYGLHMIPTKTNWTIIFSKATSSWGSYSYKEEEDALRVTVTPKSGPHVEALVYYFNNLTAESSTLNLAWEKLIVPIKISANVHNVVIASMRDELRSLPGFTWEGWHQAAEYCLNNKTNMVEGNEWIDKSLKRATNSTNLSTKSEFLRAQGKTEEADKMLDKAMGAASNAELNLMGYSLMGKGNMGKAHVAFKKNTELHPDDPNVWDSLGEFYVSRGAKGDKELAVASIKKSLSLDPPDNVKANSMDLLKKLGLDYKEVMKSN